MKVWIVLRDFNKTKIVAINKSVSRPPANDRIIGEKQTAAWWLEISNKTESCWRFWLNSSYEADRRSAAPGSKKFLK